MLVQEIGNNNMISKLDSDSVLIDICGSNNKVDIIDNPGIQNLTVKIIGNNNIIVIKDEIKIKEKLYIYVDDHSTYLEIGKNTTFENTAISITDYLNKVIIGEDCMFAAGTMILAGDFHSIIDLETKKRINYGCGIIIEDHVWIGLGAKILKNVYIEKNSIIAAGSLVTNDVPTNSIVGGISAKIIKRGVTWTRERIIEGQEVLNKDFLDVEDSELLLYNLEDSNQEIRGWIFLLDKDSSNSKLYIEIIYENEDIERRAIPLTARRDVSDFYNNIKYLFSGFLINRKEGQILKKIRLIIENSDFLGCKTIWVK